MGEVTRRYSEEEAGRLMKEVMENNAMIIKSQKQIMELQIAMKEEERRREIRRQREKKKKKQISGWKNIEGERRKKRAKEIRQGMEKSREDENQGRKKG